MTAIPYLRRVRVTVAERARPLSPLDRLTLLYAAFSTAVLMAHVVGWRHEPLPIRGAAPVFIANGLLMLAVAAAPWARCSRSQRFLAEWYVAIVLVGLYATVGTLNAPAAGGGGSYDALVQRWDQALFGFQPAWVWPRAMPSRWFAEFLSVCYLSFYAVVISVPATLWATGRHPEARKAIFAILLTFFSCYAIFLLFPVVGPYGDWPWPVGRAWTGPATRAVHHVLETGDSWGSAFPSSHVAASVVALVCAFRSWRPLGWILLTPVIGILLAVVYLQAHYGVDALAGLAMAGFASWIAPRLCREDCLA